MLCGKYGRTCEKSWKKRSPGVAYNDQPPVAHKKRAQARDQVDERLGREMLDHMAQKEDIERFACGAEELVGSVRRVTPCPCFGNVGRIGIDAGNVEAERREAIEVAALSATVVEYAKAARLARREIGEERSNPLVFQRLIVRGSFHGARPPDIAAAERRADGAR